MQTQTNKQSNNQTTKRNYYEIDFQDPNFDFNNIVCKTPEFKTSKFDSKARYTDLPLAYTYPDGHIDELRLQFPEMESPWGVSEFTNTKEENTDNNKPNTTSKGDGYVKISRVISSQLDKNGAPFEILNNIHLMCAYLIDSVKDKIPGFADFDKEKAKATGLELPYAYKKDPNTRIIIPGRDPDFKIKVVYNSVFKKPDNTHIDPKMLKKVNIKYIPLIHFEKIHCGENGKGYIQCKLISCIITSIQMRANNKAQLETGQRFVEQNPNVCNEIDEALQMVLKEKQEMEKQEILEKTHFQEEHKLEDDSLPSSAQQDFIQKTPFLQKNSQMKNLVNNAPKKINL